MDIPSYRIYNVLKIFSRRLFEEENRRRHPSSRQQLDIHRASITSEGKLRSVTERVTTEIFDRLSQSSMSSLGQAGSDSAPPQKLTMTFPILKKITYDLIDSQNRKGTATMTLEDPSALIERLEHSAKESVDHQAELPGGIEK